MIRKVAIVLLGLLFGGLAGLIIPVGFSLMYLFAGGDETTAGGFSFLAMITMPAGAILGALFLLNASTKPN